VPGRYMYTCFERRRGWLAVVCVCEKTSFFFFLISFFSRSSVTHTFHVAQQCF
jgi:hypothetical protein